ncbi:MAG: hypothetical protein Kow0013_11880 [Pararhodobacter sp.]
MTDPDDNAPLPADLRFLKALVTALAGVMMLGLLAIVWLLVTRLGVEPPLPVLPDTVILPAGARPAAVTFASDWLVVVTETGEILLYDRAGGEPQSRTPAP